MFRVEIDSDVLFRKLYILYKNVFLFLWIRKVLDLLILFVMKCGSKKIVVRRFDVVMLVIVSRIFFFIFMNVVIRREFFIKDVNSVKMCIVVVGWLRFVFE